RFTVLRKGYDERRSKRKPRRKLRFSRLESSGCGRVKQIQELQLLFRGQEGRFERIARQFAQVLVGEPEGLLCDLVFARQGRPEHGWVIRVERDHDAMVKIVFRGMVVEVRAETCAQIAGEADFHGHLALPELFHQIGIVECGKSVANALDAKVERAPYRFRRASLSRMRGQSHAVFGGPGVSVAEELRRSFLLVSSNADANNFTVVIADRKLENLLRGLSAKLAHSIEDPHQRYAEVAGAAGPAAVESLEDGGEILLAPQAHSHRNVNLGMQNVFFFEPLHQPVRDEFVIVRRAQVFGNVLESQQKAGKIRVAIELIDLSLVDTLAAPPAEFEQRSRLDCTLKMQVQFRLRQESQEAARPIRCGRHYFLIVDSCGKICEEWEPQIYQRNTEERRMAESESL